MLYWWSSYYCSATDCNILPLTGFKCFCITGLNAQKWDGVDWVWIGSLNAPLLKSTCGANNNTSDGCVVGWMDLWAGCRVELLTVLKTEIDTQPRTAFKWLILIWVYKYTRWPMTICHYLRRSVSGASVF